MFNVYVDFLFLLFSFFLFCVNGMAAVIAVSIAWEEWAATPPVAQKKAGRPEVGARAKRNLRLWMGWIDEEPAAQADFLRLDQFVDELAKTGLGNFRDLLIQTGLSGTQFDEVVNTCMVLHRGCTWVDMNDLAHKLDLRMWKARNWF